MKLHPANCIVPPHIAHWENKTFKFDSMSRDFVAVGDAIARNSMQGGDMYDATLTEAILETIHRVEIDPPSFTWWPNVKQSGLIGLEYVDNGTDILNKQAAANPNTNTIATSSSATTSMPHHDGITLQGHLAAIPADSMPRALIAWCTSVSQKSTLIKHAKQELYAQQGMTCLSAFATLILCTDNAEWITGLTAACLPIGATKVIQLGLSNGMHTLNSSKTTETVWARDFVDSFISAITPSNTKIPAKAKVSKQCRLSISW
jgi:hypothetical protein